MAQVIGGFGVSHSPSMGYEYDKGMAGKFDPRWKIWFDGMQPVKRWLAERPGLADREEFIDDIPYPETQNYVKRILGTAEDYRRLYK